MLDLTDILNRCTVGPQDGRELTVGEATAVLELAEIGRLAVEHLAHVDATGKGLSADGVYRMIDNAEVRNRTIRDFLARHAKGKP